MVNASKKRSISAIEQQDDGISVPTMNCIVSALRLFFTHTVDRPDLARKLVRLAQADLSCRKQAHLHRQSPRRSSTP